MNTDFAYEFINAGIGILPVQYRDKRPEGALLPNASWKPLETQLPTEQEITHWFSGPRNWGVIMGWRDLAVLDFDDMTEYNQWRMWAARQVGMARTIAEHGFRVRSSRGMHVYLRIGQRGQNRKIGKIDVKFHGYVLGPGSIHPSGAEYQALQPSLSLFWVRDLAQVLPGAVLTHTELPDNVMPTPVADPWAQAMRIGQGKPHSVETIRKHFRVEDFFTDLASTSMDGRWKITRCPLHADKKPSFWLDTERQICGCFAGCTSKPLDVINLYATLYGMSNSEAIKLLSDKC